MTFTVPNLEPAIWAALIAAGVALIVGIAGAIVGPVVAASSARRALESQRRMATDARIWTKRAETYEAILSWAGQIRDEAVDVATRALEEKDPALVAGFRNALAFPRSIQVGLAAYSSAAVNGAAHTFLESLERLAEATEEAVETPGPDGALKIQLMNLQHETLANHMAQVISDDLHDVIAPDYGRVS
jgi:hypothetical protein